MDATKICPWKPSNRWGFNVGDVELVQRKVESPMGAFRSHTGIVLMGVVMFFSAYRFLYTKSMPTQMRPYAYQWCEKTESEQNSCLLGLYTIFCPCNAPQASQWQWFRRWSACRGRCVSCAMRWPYFPVACQFGINHMVPRKARGRL